MNDSESVSKRGEPRLALVHDWLVTLGGAERVIAAMMELWPSAPVYTMIYDPQGSCAGFTKGHTILPSFIQKLPGARKHHRYFIPLMPLAVEQFDLSKFDIVISSSHAVAKGALTGPFQLHICYFHAPFRYAWDLQGQYLPEFRLHRSPRSALARLLFHYLRLWDLASANRVDIFLANSQYTARKVRKYYHRTAQVIYPPVDTDFFQPGGTRQDYYLTGGRLVPYKRVELVIEAFKHRPDLELVVMGDGPERRKLQENAGPNIQFTGFLQPEALRGAMQNARAFIHAALEDFGITPVEALACGTPVIAFGRGGVRETVIPGKTGLWFLEQQKESLLEAIAIFEQRPGSFNPDELHRHAEAFGLERFQLEIGQFVLQQWEDFNIVREGSLGRMV